MCSCATPTSVVPEAYFEPPSLLKRQSYFATQRLLRGNLQVVCHDGPIAEQGEVESLVSQKLNESDEGDEDVSCSIVAHRDVLEGLISELWDTVLEHDLRNEWDSHEICDFFQVCDGISLWLNT